MVSIRSFTDEELLTHITVNQELLEMYDYGTADYNSADSELRVARSEQMRREIVVAEAKDKLVLEYTRLCLIFTDPDTTADRRANIRIRLNEIRSTLGMKIDTQHDLLRDLMLEQLETM